MIFLVVFAATLVVPLLQTVYPVFGTIVPPVDEHRDPGPFPSLKLLLNTTGDFAAGLNQWFNDRVGLRDLFIRTKNQIDYSLFRTSRKVLVGSDGWLFDRGDPGIDIERLDQAGLDSVEKDFVDFARRLQERGVRLLVVGYPDKSRIYPEKMPADAPVIAPGGNYDKLRQFLATQSSFMFIDAETILLHEKRTTTEDLFLKTDMHIDEVGQLAVVKEIVARIAAAEGRPDIHWAENFKLAHGSMPAGGQDRFMSLLINSHENEPYYQGAYTIGGKESDGEWYLPNPRVLVSADDGIGRSFDWEFRARPELCAQRLPGMVLFGNSFSDFYWALGLQRYFCFIRRARTPMSRFAAFFAAMPEGTRYFIFQYYLPFLPDMVPPPE